MREATGSRQRAAGLRAAVLVVMLGVAALLAGCSGKDVPDGWIALIFISKTIFFTKKLTPYFCNIKTLI